MDDRKQREIGEEKDDEERKQGSEEYQRTI